MNDRIERAIRLAAVGTVVLAALGIASRAGVQTSGASPRPATAPAYTWPEIHQNPQLTGVSDDPSLSTTDAGGLGVRWMENTGSQALGSPVVGWDASHNRTLVLVPNDAGYLIAYDRSTGLPVWSDPFASGIVSTPLIEGSNVWIGPLSGGRLYKLNLSTGATECSAPVTDANGQYIESEPTLATPPGGRSTVYIGAVDNGVTSGPLTAVNEADCTIDFSVSYEPVSPSTGIWDPISYGVDATGEPLVLYGTSNPDSEVYVVDAITGALVWHDATAGTGAGDYDVGAGIVVSPPGVNGFADGVAYVDTKAGIMYALDLTTGSLIWQYHFGGVTLSTAALSGTNLVFGISGNSEPQGGVIDLNAVSGALQWQFTAGAEVDSSPAIVGPTGRQIVAFGDVNGEFYVISLAAGALLYHYQTGQAISASPCETNGNLIISSADGYVYDFAVGGGNDTPPTTAVSSPADSSSVANPNGKLTIRGSATSASDISKVSVFIQEGGSTGRWWDGATGSWSAAPCPDPAALAAPGTTQTSWSVTVPVGTGGGLLEVLASAVNASGIADRSAEEGVATAARSTFTVLPSTTAPKLSASARFIAPDAGFTITGSGFAHGERVTLTLGKTTLESLTASSSGTIGSTTVTLPASVAFGPQSLTATGAISKKSTTTGIYVSNAWNQFQQSSLHQGNDPNDGDFSRATALGPKTFLEQAWSFVAAAPIVGSVAVVDDRAYAADTGGAVYAVNVGTGRQMWTYHDSGSPITGTPAVTSGSVIVGTAAGRVIAINTGTGKLTWTTVVGHGAIESAPTFDGTDVYVASEDGYLSALNATTGTLVWTATLTGAPGASSPAVDPSAGVVAVGDASGDVSAFSTTAGTPLWTSATGGAVSDSPVISGGMVFIGSSDGDVLALNETSGSTIWSYSVGEPVSASPALIAGMLVVGAPNGTEVYLDPATGAVAYDYSLGGSVTGIGGAQDFVTTDLASGTVVGSKYLNFQPKAWTASTGGALHSAPTVVNGEVFVTGESGAIQCYTIPTQPPV